MMQGWVKPTNYEMIEMADAIVVADATSGATTSDSVSDSTVLFTVTEIIYGAPTKTISSGWARLGENVTPSDPNQIISAHPESFAGPCSRMTFEKGKSYILLLKKNDDNVFNIGIDAFSRDREDYSNLWSKTIRYYLAIQAEPNRYEQLNILSEKYQEFVKFPKDSDEYKIAMDIADHLSSTSPYKPSQYLIETYQALEQGKALPFGIRHPDANKEDSDAQRISDFIMGVKREEFTVKAQKEYILWALSEEGHDSQQTRKFFEKQIQLNKGISTLGPAISFYANNGFPENAVELAQQYLPALIVSANPTEMRAVERTFRQIEFPKTKEMAEFQFSITKLMNFRFGEYNYGVGKEVLNILKPENFRDRPDVAEALVRSYEDDPVLWAVDELSRLVTEKENAFSSKYLLPIKLLLIDFNGRDNIDRIDAVFCNEDTRPALLKNLGRYEGTYTDELVVRLASRIDLMDEEEIETFLRALTSLSAVKWDEYVGDNSDLFWGGSFDNIYIELIEKIFKEEDILPMERESLNPKTPLKCEGE